MALNEDQVKLMNYYQMDEFKQKLIENNRPKDEKDMVDAPSNREKFSLGLLSIDTIQALPSYVLSSLVFPLHSISSRLSLYSRAFSLIG